MEFETKRFVKNTLLLDIVCLMGASMVLSGCRQQSREQDAYVSRVEIQELPMEEMYPQQEKSATGGGTNSDSLLDKSQDGSGLDGETDGELTNGADAADAADQNQAKEPENHRITITISGAGDVTLGGYAGQAYGGSFDEEYKKQNEDPAYFFANVYDIFSQDDVTIVNLEGPLTTATTQRTEKEFNIKGDPAYVNILPAGGIEMVGFANNHRLDYREEGANETTQILDEAGIPWACENQVGIYEVQDGISVGVVAVSGFSMNQTLEKTIQNGINSLWQQGADLVVVCIHWGIERNAEPEKNQIQLGHKCIDWGADLVLGSHPHVVQGVEAYNGKFIAYSLGNFCFGGNRNPVDKDSMILQQSFVFDDGELVESGAARVIPCSISSVQNRNDYQPTPAQGAEYDRILQKINDRSAIFSTSFDAQGWYVDPAAAQDMAQHSTQ